MDLTEWAKGYYRAYETGDRDFIENNLAPGFTFTSPYDDAIGRDEYFARCWPGHTNIAKFTFVAVAQDGDGVLVLYEAQLKAHNPVHGGTGFRNAEYLSFENGKLKSVEVYFGDPPRGLTRREFAAESGAI
jgi:ketosteroid isomerase-like protein